MFVIMHPSRCFPSLVVVVVMIAATTSDQHVLTIHGSCVPAMVSCLYPLDSAHLQQHPTSSDQAPPDSATTSEVSANVSDFHRFHVFLQHSLLLSCHSRFVLEHRSSSLGNVIEFPNSCTLLGSKRSTQLLSLITQ